MKRGSLRGLRQAIIFSTLLLSGLANASYVAVLPGVAVLPSPGDEPDLAASGGILDTSFGLENLSRVDDSLDQQWVNSGRIDVKTVGKWAGFKQSFGFINAEGDFTSLLNVNNHWSRPAAHFDREASGSLFSFGLNPSGSSLWSSYVGDNSDLFDHMVTWKITSSHNKNLIGAFVIGWEDLADGGDQDFNDLVLLVKGDISLNTLPAAAQGAVVPIPAALWLFCSGLLGLAAAARRRAG